MIFDTHAHYDDDAFLADREEVLASLSGQGVKRLIDVGASVKSFPLVREIADTHDFVWGALGLHPDEVGGLTDAFFAELEAVLSDPKIVAVGEIGLDYHWDVEPHEVQAEAFRRQASLAIRKGLPVIVHSRAAAEDTMILIRELYGPGTAGALLPRKGVIHAYAYSAELARQYTELGFFLGIGGVLTFKNSKKLKKVVREISLTNLLLETDCPYLAPEPHRGERNTSAYLPCVVQAIAEIKEIAPEEVEDVTWRNACRLFGLPE